MDFPKILILRLSAIGDVIRTLPSVKAIKAKLPSSSITWVVEEPSKSFLESQPEITNVILFPRKRWSEGLKSPKRWWGTAKEVRRFILALRREKFGVVLDFHGILKSGLISFLSGSSQRIGFDRKSSREGNFLFSNKRVKIPRGRISRFKQNVALLKGMDLAVQDVSCQLHIPEEDRETVSLFFDRFSFLIKGPRIAIHPGSSQKAQYKRWEADRYALLGDKLVRELGATVIFTWGPGELEWVMRIQKKMKESSILGPHTTSLTQLGEVYRRCGLYVGGDTGPMHIASLMGIPVVVIYGPTDPVVNEPFGPHKIVRKEVGCNPCRNRSCRDPICLTKVSVEEVFKAVREFFP